jgi:sigma-E factor negative regulatory protein RseB
MILAASPRVRGLVPALAAAFACSAQAAPAAPDNAIGWLQRAAESARSASYAGTFVHTNGDRISTVRITHLNSAGDETERIEALDGPPYEIVRHSEEMFCYFPDAKTVRLDRRVTAQFFPSILRGTAESIARSYDVKLGKSERVLGYDCQWIRLEPKDNLRYTQRLCSEFNTGLVIRARTLDAQQHVIEQYTFTDLRLGPHVGRADVRSIFEAHVKRWTTDSQPREESKSVDTGWAVTNPPAGFEKVIELKRTMPGRTQPVSHLVYTDGVASVSVFIEPNGAPTRTAEAATEEGSTTFFVRPMGDQVVTVLGEVPLATAQQVGRSVAKR